MIAYMMALHKQQRGLGGRSHHEQSSKSRAPSNGGDWPWAISRKFKENTVTVAACAVRNFAYLLELNHLLEIVGMEFNVLWSFV